MVDGLASSGVWVQGIYGILLFFGAVAMYLSRRTAAPEERPKQDHIIAGVGVGWLSAEQTERFLSAVDAIAAAAKSIAKHQETDMAEKIEKLTDQLARTERANEDRERALIAREHR